MQKIETRFNISSSKKFGQESVKLSLVCLNGFVKNARGFKASLTVSARKLSVIYLVHHEGS